MSIIKSSSANLTLNADGTGSDIKFQSNGSEKASLSSAGVLTATSFSGSGASLTGVGVTGITSAANATALSIDSDEIVTMPFQPSFLMRGYAGRLTGDIVYYTSTAHNIGSHYNNSTGKFTAPVAGRYFFSWLTATKLSSTYMEWSLMVNGVLHLSCYSTTGLASYDLNGGVAVLDLAATDYVNVRNSSSYTSPTSTTVYTHFSGQLLG
jgi:hypothetical protein